MDRFPQTAATTQATDLKLSELIGSLSYALDITEGQPAGHCVRLLDRHAYRPRRRHGHGAAVGAVLRAAAQGPGLQQQCRAHLRAVHDRRPRFQARFKTVGDSLPQVLASCSSIPA
jgi:hypothetical protein